MAADTEPHAGTNGQLFGFVLRIERQEVDKAEVADGIKDTYAEVKAAGFTPKTVRKLVKLRLADASARSKLAEEDAELELYARECGVAL